MKKLDNNEYWILIGIALAVITTALYDIFTVFFSSYLTEDYQLSLVKAISALVSIGLGFLLFLVARR